MTSQSTAPQCGTWSKTAAFSARRLGLAMVCVSSAACHNTPRASSPDSPQIESRAAANESADLSAGFKQAGWGDNVSVTYANGKLRFQSNGIPNHDRNAEYAVPGGGAGPGGPGGPGGAGPGGRGAPGGRAGRGDTGGMVLLASNATAVADPTQSQHYDFSIPTSPVKAAAPTPAPLGVIGVMISGASLFNPYEGDGVTVATQSNFSVKGTDGKDVWFLDRCNGHPQPMMGMYHYHALPPCVTSQVDQPGGPSHIIGIAFDGYPIYGDRDVNGKPIDASRLDSCNGITSPTPEFPSGVYHYVLLNVAGPTSSIRCFSGVVDPSLIRPMPGMRRSLR